jgi:hypothetical protein
LFDTSGYAQQTGVISSAPKISSVALDFLDDLDWDIPQSDARRQLPKQWG